MTELIAVGAESPWGEIIDIFLPAPEILFVHTHRHSGYYLSPVLNALMPEAFKAATFEQVWKGTFGPLGRQGWYEQDCDADFVVLAFPDQFPRHVLAAGINSARNGAHAGVVANWWKAEKTAQISALLGQA